MSSTNFRNSLFASVLMATLATPVATVAYASPQQMGGHGSQMGGSEHSSAIGQPGKAADATQTIEIIMRDNSFDPEKISVTKGETVRFLITNKGEFVHEFNISTAAMQASHQKEMMTMMEHGILEADKINRDRMKMDMGDGKTMEHSNPNSALLEPGASAEIVWTFSTDAELEFACNVPGHYQSGMVGEIEMKHGS